MERNPVFMDWKLRVVLFCFYVDTSQSDLQIQFNPYQNPIVVFFSLQNGKKKIFLKFIWNPKGYQRTKIILKKKYGGFIFPDFKRCYKAIRNQNSMTLT